MKFGIEEEISTTARILKKAWDGARDDANVTKPKVREKSGKDT